jgi:FAD:protein FMN transferase
MENLVSSQHRNLRPLSVLRSIMSALLALLISSCATPSRPELRRFEFTRPEMGLPFRIVLYAPSAELASGAAEAAFARISELNSILSDYDSDSELSRLSRTSGSNQEIPVSHDLWAVLSRSQEISRQSDGTFDITVGPLVNLWRKARRDQKLPRRDLLETAKSRVGYTNIVLNSRRKTAKLLRPDMRLDVGGIGKGYALDEALKVLKNHGVSRALVTGGGDMAAGEPPPGQKGWRIEIAPLDVTNAPPARFVSLVHAGLATSGDLFQRLEIDGRRYSHIVDPRTGFGLTNHSLVTIIARDCTTADGLSKVVSVLGSDKGFRIVRSNGAAAHIVEKPEDLLQHQETANFSRHIIRRANSDGKER